MDLVASVATNDSVWTSLTRKRAFPISLNIQKSVYNHWNLVYNSALLFKHKIFALKPAN